MKPDKIDVVVWKECGDNPDKIIINGVCGEATLNTLKEIEEMFNDPESEFNIPPAPVGYMIGVRCSVYWDSGETQYGTGYGDVITFDGYWYPDIDGYVVVDLSMDADADDTIASFPCNDFETNLRNYIYVRSQQKINNVLGAYSGGN